MEPGFCKGGAKPSSSIVKHPGVKFNEPKLILLIPNLKVELVGHYQSQEVKRRIRR